MNRYVMFTVKQATTLLLAAQVHRTNYRTVLRRCASIGWMDPLRKTLLFPSLHNDVEFGISSYRMFSEFEFDVIYGIESFGIWIFAQFGIESFGTVFTLFCRLDSFASMPI